MVSEGVPLRRYSGAFDAFGRDLCVFLINFPQPYESFKSGTPLAVSQIWLSGKMLSRNWQSVSSVKHFYVLKQRRRYTKSL